MLLTEAFQKINNILDNREIPLKDKCYYLYLVSRANIVGVVYPWCFQKDGSLSVLEDEGLISLIESPVGYYVFIPQYLAYTFSTESDHLNRIWSNCVLLPDEVFKVVRPCVERLYPMLSFPVKKSKSSPQVSVEFDFENKTWIGITDELIEYWKKTFPAVNIQSELKKMGAWLVANPTRKKKNYKRFIYNWLARAQDKSRVEAKSWAERMGG
jgi:hypothetical protein